MHPCWSVSCPWTASLSEMCLLSGLPVLLSLDPHRDQDDLEKHHLIPLASTTSRVVSSPLALQLLLWGSPGRFQAQRLCTCCSFCLECSSPQYPCGSLISSRFSRGHLLRPCLSTPFQVAAPFPITADVPLPPTPCLSSSH